LRWRSYKLVIETLFRHLGVTHETGGLGQKVTTVFSNLGATVAVVGRHPAKNLPDGVLGFTADVTDETDVQRLVSGMKNKTKRVDCLINLVGGFAMGRLTEITVADWSKMLTLNLNAAFLLTRAVTPAMIEQGSGRVIHIGAQAAIDPFPGAAAYIVSKSGLAAMIKVLALELAGSGVTINGVLPTIIDTPANRQNMPNADYTKWVKPESIAQLLAFLASDEAGAINGALIPIGSN
jgi:NAD(P)-dependent dehydrogenase (short-subunit alcohol dehydrogenase family)